MASSSPARPRKSASNPANLGLDDPLWSNTSASSATRRPATSATPGERATGPAAGRSSPRHAEPGRGCDRAGDPAGDPSRRSAGATAGCPHRLQPAIAVGRRCPRSGSARRWSSSCCALGWLPSSGAAGSGADPTRTYPRPSAGGDDRPPDRKPASGCNARRLHPDRAGQGVGETVVFVRHALRPSSAHSSRSSGCRSAFCSAARSWSRASSPTPASACWR